MKERPILFSGEMVRAILDGRKSQTRRLITPQQPKLSTMEPYELEMTERDGAITAYTKSQFVSSRHNRYGVVGDRLWVRESWGLHAHGDETDWYRGSVRGCQAESLRAQYNIALRADWGPLQEGCLWRPGIFLPRWASRITLEITEVRVQRLQEISEDDARAEGVEPYTPPHGHISPEQRVPGPGFDRCRLGDQPHRLPFADLWDSVNRMRAAWASNPWVWALSFRRLP